MERKDLYEIIVRCNREKTSAVVRNLEEATTIYKDDRMFFLTDMEILPVEEMGDMVEILKSDGEYMIKSYIEGSINVKDKIEEMVEYMKSNGSEWFQEPLRNAYQYVEY